MERVLIVFVVRAILSSLLFSERMGRFVLMRLRCFGPKLKTRSRFLKFLMMAFRDARDAVESVEAGKRFDGLLLYHKWN